MVLNVKIVISQEIPTKNVMLIKPNTTLMQNVYVNRGINMLNNLST